MIKKYAYESTPYAYLAISSVLLLTTHSALLLFGALALYIAGASIWVSRSMARSRQSRHHPASAYLNHDIYSGEPLDHYRRVNRIPRRVYEYLPFICLLTAFWCYRYQLTVDESVLIWPSMILFTIAGLWIWTMRAYFRGYHRSHSVSQLLS
ncbi:MAG: hypothetical protein OQK12_00260 [Motiliproteus sp.]|nr:hypothetical protein [Motiliproteus sp.]MCW9051716.1 hypothetical protein [Motiliproteus sp.]